MARPARSNDPDRPLEDKECALPRSLSVDTHPGVVAPADAAGLWTHGFTSPQMVSAAASMFHGHRVEDRRLGVTLLGSPLGSGPSYETAVELGHIHAPATRDRAMVEGPRWRIMVSPGTVSVRRQDPARRERAHERLVLAEQGQDGLAVMPEAQRNGTAVISSWSRKSRARMVEKLAQLDVTPLIGDGSAVPAMVTLTYPGDWLAVAPDSAAATRHVGLLRKRFARAWGTPLIGVWKREFQERGAPHFHIWMVPPTGRRKGLNFRDWLAREWALVVDARRCTEESPVPAALEQLVNGTISCCEYHRHVAAGTGIDYVDGIKARDPKALGVYFAKHGSFAAKEYQNSAPKAWVDAGSVGRFWGLWGLSTAVAGTLVEPDDAQAAVRTLRRWSRSRSYVARVPAWKYRERVDHETGEVTAKWRHGSRLKRVYRMKGEAGFVVAPDAPALASQLARHLDRLRRPDAVIGRAGGSPPRGALTNC